MYIFVKARQINSEDSDTRPRLSISYSSTNRYNAMLQGCNVILCSSTTNILCHYSYEPSFEYTMTEAGLALGQSFKEYVETLHPLFLSEESSSSL